MASGLWIPPAQLRFQYEFSQFSTLSRSHFSNFRQYHHSPFVVEDRLIFRRHRSGPCNKTYCYDSSDPSNKEPERTGIQLYRDIERLLTESAKQSQAGWVSSRDWTEVEGAWVLKPRNSKPRSVVHFVGGIFVGAAPQLTYRLFLEGLSEKGVLVIATPYASGFDHFFIADDVQLKFDRCLRFLQETVQDLPTFGIGHSLGSVIHLLIGSRYAVQRNGNVLMAFNSKEASLAVPLFSPVLVPMAQSIGPLLSQIASSPTVRLGAEITMKQLENLSPPIMKQVLPLVEQLPPLYMDLVNGRENFTPKPEETRRLIKSYYGISRNLLIKFKDDTIDETSALAQVLTDSAISSMLDMSIRSLPGDHGLPLQQALPNVPPAMADAVNKGGEFLANLTAGTPWETAAREMSNTLGVDSRTLRAETSKDIDLLVEVIASWMASNTGPKLLRS
ncbi:Mitochondrial translation factor like [Actinidia chinensis var. chinensis]|uniref:Mitochondrial translation factor like n=1 Tax=Actinidia chinensis var. chinensis TaxID=1590841 RepID=A0A2R6Q850_ACTCC|nr:Mitochondrial translation factor like [Actinidia chinensis var. chinensis]